MAKVMSVVKSLSRAAAVAVALGASTLVAAPAFAQAPGLSFEVQFGNGHGHGNGPRPGWGNDDDWGNGGYQTRCLSNREVRAQVGQYGYYNVDVVRELSRNRVDVTGVRGNWLYTMRVDKCSGAVSQPQRVRNIGSGFPNGGGYPNGGGHNTPRNGGGFGFEFNFGKLSAKYLAKIPARVGRDSYLAKEIDDV